jgi:hypothetical protein
MASIDEPSVAHGAAEPSGLTMETRSPRPGERRSPPEVEHIVSKSIVKLLEHEFKIRLHADYRKLHDSFPVPLMKLMSCEEEPSARSVYNDLKTLVSENRLMRNRGPTNGFDWPDKYVIIGGDLGGNYYCLNVHGASSAVYYWFHETGEFSLYARSLASFILKVFQDYAESTLDVFDS